MKSLMEVLKSAASGEGNVAEAIMNDSGTYKDAVADNLNQESKTAHAVMPKGVDPSPFSVGSIPKK
jgi:hypothetical protein